MHFNICDIFNSQSFHKHVTAGIAVICRVMILRENKRTNVLNTLRTGLLNCLNARSRGLTFRHRASCI